MGHYQLSVAYTRTKQPELLVNGWPILLVLASLGRLNENEIDHLLDKFIEEYQGGVARYGNHAVNLLLERLRTFLREHAYDDFKDESDFAERAFGTLDDELRAAWSSASAINAITRATKSIYRFYRLKDPTPFSDTSSIKLRFGGADTRSLKFFGELDHFYFSKFAPNKSDELKSFLRERYLEHGSKIFGKRTPEELDDFRKAAGEKLKNLNDRAVETIIHTSVQRIRSWGHVGSMAQARIKLARIVAILDSRTSEICRELDGKIIRIGTAQAAIERLNKLEPGEFAAEMYESDAGRAMSRDPVNFINGFIEDDGKTISDDLGTTGRAVPPYHPKCRSRLAAIIAGAKS
jgi:hypothetical protein